MSPRTMYVTVKAVLIKADRLLLLKKTIGNFWNLPGGRIEFGESITAALERELHEELPGVMNVKIGELLGARKKELPLEDGNELFITYYLVQAELPDKIDISDEHTEAHWFSLQEICTLEKPLCNVYVDLFIKARKLSNSLEKSSKKLLFN